jgi:hypothetical protein
LQLSIAMTRQAVRFHSAGRIPSSSPSRHPLRTFQLSSVSACNNSITVPTGNGRARKWLSHPRLIKAHTSPHWRAELRRGNAIQIGFPPPGIVFPVLRKAALA